LEREKKIQEKWMGFDANIALGGRRGTLTESRDLPLDGFGLFGNEEEAKS